MSRWKVSVDKNLCIGSAMCAAIAPDRFVLDKRQRSGPVEAEIEPDELVRDAAASCPSEAISLVDADTGQPVNLDLRAALPSAASERAGANPDLAGHTPWGVFQAVVQALTGCGLIVIPNCHMLFGGWCCSTADNNGLWYNDNWPASRFQTAWQTIATAFARNPLVAAYDIKNEPRNATIGGAVRTPTWGDGNTGTDFRLMYQQIGNLIHQHDPDALIICEGLSYAASLTGVPAYPVRLVHPNKVVYSGHDYPWFGHAANQSQTDYLDQMHTNLGRVMDSGSWQAPLWLGEFDVDNQSPSILDASIPHGASSPYNAGTANWWHNVTAWLTQTDADWCYWHLGGTHVKGTEPVTNRLIYSKDDRCSSGVFAQDWQGPSSPYLLAALQKLQPASSGPGVS